MSLLTKPRRKLRLANRLLALAVIVAAAFAASPAQGQLFPPARTLGQPLSRRPGPGAASAAAAAVEQVGTLQGNERFLRDNRGRGDFVGNNRRSLEGFVGLEQAIGVGQIRSAIESLRDFQDRSQSLNQALDPPGPRDMYYPRLTVDFKVPQPSPGEKSVEIQTRLLNLKVATAEHPIEVFVSNRQAILRGVVPSEEMAARAVILVGFEPGIDAVTSELQIDSATDHSVDD